MRVQFWIQSMSSCVQGHYMQVSLNTVGAKLCRKLDLEEQSTDFLA